MQKSYSIVTRQGKYGLVQNNEEVISCKFDKIWQITEDLFGLREDNYWEIYSLKAQKTIYPPFLKAVIPVFKPYSSTGKVITVPRYLSAEGLFEKSMIFIEDITAELWQDDKLLVVGELELVQITRSGEVDYYAGEDYDEQLTQVKQLCWVQLPGGGNKVSSISSFRYFSVYDEEIDEVNFIVHLAVDKPAFVEELRSVLEYNRLLPEPEQEKAFIPFSYESLPPTIVAACKGHLDNFYSVDNSDEEITRNLIFLAWLYANGFIINVEDVAHLVDCRFDYDASFLFDADIGNLYQQYALEELTCLLRVSGTTGGYLEVLAFLN